MNNKEDILFQLEELKTNILLVEENKSNKEALNKVYISFTKNIDGNKNIKGILKEVKDDSLLLDVEGNEFSVPKDKIKSANLEGEI
jgi:ribosome maturation factor RimP